MNNAGKKNNLIWLDLEMTGLNPDLHRIIEIAVVITDGNLNIIADGPELAIYQPEPVLQLMDEWNVKQHTESSLIDRVRNSTITEEIAQAQILEFLMQYVQPKKSPMCGNSICMDRRFLYKWMPKLEQYFHYRNLDVSTLKILAQMWAPYVYAQIKKDSNHRARDDIYESINELKLYQKSFMRVGVL